MTEDIKQLKKVELHFHLDGSVPMHIIKKLSGRTEEEIKKEMVASDKCENLSEYLTKFDLPLSYMQTKEDILTISKAVLDYFEEQNVIYAEIRFAPTFHTRKGLTKAEVIETLITGLNQSSKVKTNIIACLHRNVSMEDNYDTLNVVKDYIGKGVCALDLAGAEDMYPLQQFLPLFEKANELNIPYTIHAGENGGPLEVEKAVEIGSRRIGHGIHSIESEHTLEILKNNNVLLEICPTSNVQTNAIDVYENHPIKEFFDNGIKVCINTDNRTISNITLCEEYQKLQDTFGFTIEDFKEMNRNAINAAFISQEEKQELLNTL